MFGLYGIHRIPEAVLLWVLSVLVAMHLNCPEKACFQKPHFEFARRALR